MARTRGPTRRLVEDTISVNVRNLEIPEGVTVTRLSKPMRKGEFVSKLDFTEIEVEWEPIKFFNKKGGGTKGFRSWFICPTCGCRRLKLYWPLGGPWACRECHSLAYQSQNLDKRNRILREYRELWNLTEGGRPKWQHRATYIRRSREFLALNGALDLILFASFRSRKTEVASEISMAKLNSLVNFCQTTKADQT